MECQQLLALHLTKSMGSTATSTHNGTIGRFSRQKWSWQHRCYVVNMSINGVSTILGIASWIIKGLCDDMNPYLSNGRLFFAKMLSTTSWLCAKNESQPGVNTFTLCIFDNQRAVQPHSSTTELSDAIQGKNGCTNVITILYYERQWSINGASTIVAIACWIIKGQWNAADPQSTYRQPLSAKILVTISRLPPTIERPQSVTNFCGGSVSYTAMKCIALFLNWVLHGQSFQYVLVYNFINLHATSHRSYFFACSSTVNI